MRGEHQRTSHAIMKACHQVCGCTVGVVSGLLKSNLWVSVLSVVCACVCGKGWRQSDRDAEGVTGQRDERLTQRARTAIGLATGRIG